MPHFLRTFMAQHQVLQQSPQNKKAGRMRQHSPADRLRIRALPE
jgi:hypothetical protein